MRTFKVFVNSQLDKNISVLVNGEKANFIKGDYNQYYHQIETEDDVVEVEVVRKHELISPLWFLWSMFFFIISCFGIFDVMFSRVTPINCKILTRLEGDISAIKIETSNNKKSNEVNVTTTACNIEDMQNEDYTLLIKKRRRILALIKALLWVAIIAAVITLVIVM